MSTRDALMALVNELGLHVRMFRKKIVISTGPWPADSVEVYFGADANVRAAYFVPATYPKTPLRKIVGGKPAIIAEIRSLLS